MVTLPMLIRELYEACESSAPVACFVWLSVRPCRFYLAVLQARQDHRADVR